jgi:hypothetical protein
MASEMHKYRNLGAVEISQKRPLLDNGKPTIVEVLLRATSPSLVFMSCFCVVLCCIGRGVAIILLPVQVDLSNVRRIDCFKINSNWERAMKAEAEMKGMCTVAL